MPIPSATETRRIATSYVAEYQSEEGTERRLKETGGRLLNGIVSEINRVSSYGATNLSKKFTYGDTVVKWDMSGTSRNNVCALDYAARELRNAGYSVNITDLGLDGARSGHVSRKVKKIDVRW